MRLYMGEVLHLQAHVLMQREPAQTCGDMQGCLAVAISENRTLRIHLRDYADGLRS
jgi:hypothetical protein